MTGFHMHFHGEDRELSIQTVDIDLPPRKGRIRTEVGIEISQGKDHSLRLTHKELEFLFRILEPFGFGKDR